MDLLHQDIRYALRGLRKSPGYAVVALVTLAIAIGANTAMFSVLNALVLRPLPFDDPDRLVTVWTEPPGQPLRQGRSSYFDVERWRAESRSFVDLSIHDPVSMTLNASGRLQQISGVRASPNYFAVLGVEPLRGRVFSAEEAEGKHPVVVVGDRFWRRYLSDVPDPIGATIEVDGRRAEVIGVLPDVDRLEADVWEPHTLFRDWEQRRINPRSYSWLVLGRLRDGVRVESAQSELNALGTAASIVPLHLHIFGSRSRLALWTLSGAVFCVLLIGVANIASLSLARSAGRAREMALRTALGAGRARLIRLRAVESLVLALAAGALGVGVAWMGIPLITSMGPQTVRSASGIDLNPRVLGWTAGISVLAGLLIGLLPALTFDDRDLRRPLHDGGRGASGGRATRLAHSALVVAQFAMAIVLLVGAGLLGRSLLMVERIDPGFSADRVLSLQVSAPPAWNDARRVEYYASVLDSALGVAGVEDAGIIGDLLIGGPGEQVITVAGEAAHSTDRLRLRIDEVSEGLFDTLGIPLLSGRVFSPADRDGAPPVVVVNAAMARRLWKGQNPIGRQLKIGPPESRAPWLTVVGIVGDMRREGLEAEPVAQIFQPLAQNPSRNETVLVRTAASDPMTIASAIEGAIRRVDGAVPVYGIGALSDRLGSLQAERRFQTTLVGTFSALALFLAAIGIYGTIHYAVATRTQEIGVRMAVGAERRDIFRMIVGEGLALSAIGMTAGLVGALWAGRLVSSLLFGVSPVDPVSYVVGSLVLLGAALAGCSVPALRASRIDPLTALR